MGSLSLITHSFFCRFIEVRQHLLFRKVRLVRKSRRDSAIVAWHKVPGNRRPKRAVP
jgi:hypothetical protein